MSSRNATKARFLQQTPWAGWTHQPIAQDASSRSYVRLSNGGESVILMDAPPNAGEDIGPFVVLSSILQNMDLAAPRVLKQDKLNGFLVLEDLGTTDFATAIVADPACAATLYRAAADVLIHIAHQPAPKLPVMDAETAGEMVRITAEHYARSTSMSDALAESVSDMFRTHCQAPLTLALRDFHAENLIWRPQEIGLKRVGLLDFQDAFIAPTGYDLASLLRDARRDIDDELASMIMTYVAEQTSEPIEQLRMRIRCIAIQRNLRILGVFARLIKVQGKTRYSTMLPRVWRNIVEDLNHPALSDLRNLVCNGLPAPTVNEAII